MTNEMTVLEHRSYATPLYWLRGTLPLILKLDPLQVGEMQAILLHRKGDCSLMVVEEKQMSVDGQWAERPTDATAADHTLTALMHDGWALAGRIHIVFTGVDYDHTLFT